MFSDTSAPERLYANDGYALSDEHLGSVTGREWQKSACYQCPFQFSSKAGFAAAMERYRREPESGSRALYLEAVSVCFNPKQGLLAAGRLIDAVRAAGLTEILRLFEMRIAAVEHGLYEVRRVAQVRSLRNAADRALRATTRPRYSHRTRRRLAPAGR